MKRGFIGWDPRQLPRAALEARLEELQRNIAGLGVPALVAFSDVWRSNDVRYLSNYMPYWNRALTVIPAGEKPILLCALSPRVYPWIRSVTLHETILPSPHLIAQLVRLCAERGWTRVGVLDHEGLPYELYRQLAAEKLEIVDVPRHLVRPQAPASEVAMHRHAAKLARGVLESEVAGGAVGLTDHELTGRLELALRRAGAEDLFVLVSSGHGSPVPACGAVIEEHSSVSLALEYCGHWVKLSRNVAGMTSPLPPDRGATVHLETLSRACGWEGITEDDDAVGAVISLQVEIPVAGKRLYYGDTCMREGGGVEVL
jgi:hypothetical protein